MKHYILFILIFFSCTTYGQYYGIVGQSKSAPPLTGAALWNQKVGDLGYTQVSSGQLINIESFYDDLIEAESTGEILAVYIHANDGSEEAGWVNLISPDDFTISETGNIVWTSDVGITTSTSSSNYYNTGFAPSADGMGLYDAYLGCYVDAIGNNELVYYMGVDLAGELYIGERNAVVKQYGYISNNRSSEQVVFHSGSGWNANHLFSMSITGSAGADTDLYINDTNVGVSPFFGPVVLATNDIWIGYLNNATASTVSGSSKIAVSILATGLTAAEISDVYDAVNTYVATTSF